MEVITTTMVLTIQLLTEATTILPTLTTTFLPAHTLIQNFRLYILRNIYSKSISIKEIYSFQYYKSSKGKNVSIKYVLVIINEYMYFMKKILNTYEETNEFMFYNRKNSK